MGKRLDRCEICDDRWLDYLGRPCRRCQPPAVPAARTVRAHDRMTDAEVDKVIRGDCVIFDLEGLYWSVPTELTIGAVNDQIIVELARRRELEGVTG